MDWMLIAGLLLLGLVALGCLWALQAKPFFRWYDFWIGFYYDRDTHTLYVCPIPMFGVKIALGVK